jgi:CPA2 family monovalent cation:H+ antiporter-2
LMPPVGRSLILAGAMFSIALNPLVFGLIEPARRWIRSRSGLAQALERRDDPLAELPSTVSSESVTGHVVIVGYGRVGRRIGDELAKVGVAFVVAEQNREKVDEMRSKGVHAVVGNASEPAVLVQAHVARARLLVIATPDTVGVRRMIETAKTLNPRIEVVVRTHSEDEAELFERDHLGKVFFGEHELAMGMTRWVLERVRAPAHT